MSRPYLTIKEYSAKYGVPRTTVQKWIRDGKLEAVKWHRPMLIPDDQGVPKKRPGYFNGWRYEIKKQPFGYFKDDAGED